MSAARRAGYTPKTTPMPTAMTKARIGDQGLMTTGIPESLPCIALPISPQDTRLQPWADVVARTPPLAGHPVRAGDDLATIIYTSGTTGTPKGVMHTFHTLTWATRSGLERVPLRADGRVLSYLPLAHVAERALVEFGLLATGAHVYFADSIATFVEDHLRHHAGALED